MVEGQRVRHPLYGETNIDCIPLKPEFGSTELDKRCYLTRCIVDEVWRKEEVNAAQLQNYQYSNKTFFVTSSRMVKGAQLDYLRRPRLVKLTTLDILELAKGVHDPWVRLDELTAL
jgi:hypothetical protein